MITPEQIAKNGSEHAHQAALFCWAAVAQKYGAEVANDVRFYSNKNELLPATEQWRSLPALANLFAIPNGDQRGDGSAKGAMIAGARLKAEGQRNGVPDILLAWPVSVVLGRLHILCHGLFIEMKKPGLQTHKDGGCSTEQLDWHNRLRNASYQVVVCYSWQEARDAILEYLK